MTRANFDGELERVVVLLEHEVRIDLMAFYVTEATTPTQISRSLDVDLPTLAYHTEVLRRGGAIRSNELPPGDSARQLFEATELGILAVSQLADDQ